MGKNTSSSEQETHDFMNVESFSQLPFIRPNPVKEKGIRLFGIEFGADAVPAEDSDRPENNDAHQENLKEAESGDNSRRFECHYCFRNFPTSQALGGHQNAHKRERQHAKRQNLQTAMVNSSFSDAHHIYGLMNYRIGSTPSPGAVSTYPPWNTNINGGAARFYGATSHGSFTQTPINGSPLGMWRIPAAVQSSTSNSSFNRDLSSSHQLFAGDFDHHRQLKPPVQIIGGSSSQSRYVYEPKQSVQDHVSLDLHL